MTSNKLQQPLDLGAITLANRVLMAPMTRCRTEQPGNIPTGDMATYYAQRASAGLIISEATQISPQGQGYSFTPGIHSDQQIAGWKQVTDAVHAEGGRIFLQLWHVGRMSHQSFHHGEPPVAPSAIPPNAQVWVADANGQGRMLDCTPPRALTVTEIQHIIEEYRQAARNAITAGFDGVEIHGANGYLIDQFLRTTSNLREDAFGGSIEKRARFLIDITSTVCQEIGAERVGVRLAPYITARGMNCPEITETILYAAKQLNEQQVAYLHLAEADWDDAPVVPLSFRQTLRAEFHGIIIVAGGYDQDKANRQLESGLVDAVAFGRPFIANPDLPNRYRHQWPLSDFDPSLLFGGNEQGYLTYTPYQSTSSL